MYNFVTVVNRLEELRISQERASSEVVQLGHFLLDGQRYSSQLGDEIWVIYEQVFIAALDCNEVNFAKALLLKIGEKFPDSHRFRRLAGMSLEAQGKFEEALKIYSQILEADEAHLPTLKRKIAIAKALGDYKGAISSLLVFLDTSPLDKESWIELCELYLADSKITQAAHCLEELILIEPNNHIYHLKYAEALYTMDQFELALKAYCRVVELCPDHVRGFYGIHLCTTKLLRLSDSETNLDRKKKTDLNLLAAKRLLVAYSDQYIPAVTKKLVESYLAYLL